MRRIEYIFIFGLIIILIVPVNISQLHGVHLYQMVYPVFFVLLTIWLEGKNSSSILVKKPLQITIISWGGIAIWGTILFFLKDHGDEAADVLRFDWCFFMVAVCVSYLFYFEKKRKCILWTYAFISLAIGISGIYESITGKFYHATHSTYYLTKNSFGLSFPNTIFFNINDSATFMLFSLIIIFLLKKEVKKEKMLAITALIILGGNIVLTESRGTELGLCVFLLILAVNYNGDRYNKVFVYILSCITAAFFIIWIVNVATGVKSRMAIWHNTWTNLVNTYFVGNGPGCSVIVNEKSGSYLDNITAIHNFFLECFADYGIIGIVLLIVWYISLVGISKLYATDYFSGRICFAGLLAFIPVSISSSSLFGKAFVIVFFSIITAELNLVIIKDKLRLANEKDWNSNIIRKL